MCKMQIIYIAAVFLLAGAAQCQQPEIPLELDAIQNKINEIPGLENLNKNVPSLQEILDVAQQKCEQNGGKDAFDRLAAAKDEIQECLESNFNLTQIETELQEKSKTGSMDEVFAKYCSKRPIVEGCLKDLTNAVEPCLEESEKSSMRLLVNITKNLISFGCYKDGDHIAKRRVIRSTGDLNSLLKAFDVLKNKYDPICVNNGGPKAQVEFHDALNQLEKCQKVVQNDFTRKYEELKALPYDYMCNNYRNGLRGCLTNLTSKIEACSNRNEKYAPKLGIDIYDSLFKYLCKDNARTLKMVLGEQDHCMNAILGSTDHCISKTKHIRDYGQEAVVTKSELCSDFKLLKNCFIDVASQKCPGNTNVNDLVKGITDSIYAPCSGCNLMMNLALMIVLFLLAKLL